MDIGYARVSTQDQHLDLQEDALKRAGCEKIVVDRVSGTVAERPGLAHVKDLLRAGDTLVVWRLDRLGRRCVIAKKHGRLPPGKNPQRARQRDRLPLRSD